VTWSNQQQPQRKETVIGDREQRTNFRRMRVFRTYEPVLTYDESRKQIGGGSGGPSVAVGSVNKLTYKGLLQATNISV
jgi:hypothetical protein